MLQRVSASATFRLQQPLMWDRKTRYVEKGRPPKSPLRPSPHRS